VKGEESKRYWMPDAGCVGEGKSLNNIFRKFKRKFLIINIQHQFIDDNNINITD